MQWCSRKQNVVALPFTESDYRVVSQVSTEIGWIRRLLGEIQVSYNNPAVVCDKLSVGALASI